MNVLQGFNYGGSPRPRFYFNTKDTDKGIFIQPIKAKAATEASPFPLLQSPQAEDSASEVNTHLWLSFKLCLVAQKLKRNVVIISQHLGIHQSLVFRLKISAFIVFSGN